MAGASQPGPPVYWRFFCGGTEPLRLSPPATAVVILAGLVLPGIVGAGPILGGAPGPTPRWPSVAAGTLTAWLIAALAARWLGSRLGALAGLVQLTGAHTLLASPAEAAGMCLSAAVSGAMGAFALANVPGRLPWVDRGWTAWAFYAAAGVSFMLAGPFGPAFILAGCLSFLVLSGDSRGGRFLANPAGIAVFALLVGVRLAQPDGVEGICGGPSATDQQTVKVRHAFDGSRPSRAAQRGTAEQAGPGAPKSAPQLRPRAPVATAMTPPAVLGSLAVGLLPWTPLAMASVAIGLRVGHYATPIWRFFACWALAPVALAAVGGFHGPSQVGPLLPPLAVISAAGLQGLWVWCRLRARLTNSKQPQSSGPAAARRTTHDGRTKRGTPSPIHHLPVGQRIGRVSARPTAAGPSRGRRPSR